MTKRIYRLLQERLDLYSMGFPPTQSGIEIKILKYLFTEQDAALFLALSPALEFPDAISEGLHKPLDKTAAHLDQMAGNGLLFRLKKGTMHRYGAIPFVHGLFEFQVNTLKPDLAQMGRQISLDGAIEILKDCREAGLVTQPATARNPSGLCNCCGDCCGVLGAIGKHPTPAAMVFSNHIVAMTGNECIGCGLCVTTCPVDVLTLMDKPDKALQIPPASMGEQMMEMAKGRGII
ncbi:MAG: 4Fe-4S binding protein [Proteobacteria bacterium]|nr:4Fe-4S binding protein [Pseudomonadota bacterium]